jgi:fatty-acyl-CoA synthase
MVGAKIVFPGPKMGDGETLQQLMEEESITIASGVPTIWLGLLTYLKESGKRIDSIQRLSVGGAACPLSIIEGFRDEFGVMVHQGWGMTETSPLGTIFSLKASNCDLPATEVAQLQAKQGRGVFGIEMKITGPDGEEQAWDGVAFGDLKVRGPWVCNSYFNSDDECLDADGWFETGDVATIDPDGYMQITDRTKDVIKSGGEWISSIDLENAAVDNPMVAEAAVIGRYHPKWSERPLLIVVKHADQEIDKKAMLEWLSGRVAKWWEPDDVLFVDELPHTATGKLNKLALREQYKDYSFPDV